MNSAVKLNINERSRSACSGFFLVPVAAAAAWGGSGGVAFSPLKTLEVFLFFFLGQVGGITAR